MEKVVDGHYEERACEVYRINKIDRKIKEALCIDESKKDQQAVALNHIGHRDRSQLLEVSCEKGW